MEIQFTTEKIYIEPATNQQIGLAVEATAQISSIEDLISTSDAEDEFHALVSDCAREMVDDMSLSNLLEEGIVTKQQVLDMADDLRTPRFEE